MELFSHLAKLNDLNVRRNVVRKVTQRVRTQSQQQEVANTVVELGPKSVYIEHVNYINFTQFDLPKPIYINLVRDPVERVISWYFYERGAYKNAVEFQKFPDKPVKSESWYKKDYNHCVRSGDPECQYVPYAVVDTAGDYRRQSLFFCGHQPDCLPFNSPTAIQIAKRNVEKEYAVVGSWEDTNITLAVLEKYIPQYFQGAKFLYELHKDDITNRNKNKRKPKIHDDVKEMLASLSPDKLNNTKNASKNLVFFNRAAKVGSESMMELIKYLGKFHGYQVAKDNPEGAINSRMLKPPAERSKAVLINDLDDYTVYIQHVNYINFTKFNQPTPIYINLVRDPVERVISWFFYVRGAHKNAIYFRKHPDADVRSPNWFKKDFNKCVRTGDPECVYKQFSVTDSSGDYRRQSLFFCGHLPECLPFNSPAAIQIAKQNVERHFAVVGSWEDTNVTLTVLEKFIPHYFQGAKVLFELHQDEIKNQNKNTRKPKIEDDVKAILRKNFTQEYDFYHFCKQRLYKQYVSLNLKDLDVTL